MEGSKLGFQVWMIATFLLSTNLKSVSSMKLHRDLEITQKSAWFLAHRLRRALDRDGDMFAGPVEVDETYIGGKRKNMSNAKRKELAGTGRGAVGKTAVVGIKDRETKNVRAKVVENTAPGRPSTPTRHQPTRDCPSRTRASSTASRSMSGELVPGLYEISNKASDRHARRYNPAAHHAKLAVKAAFALCEFLVESRNYQGSRDAHSTGVDTREALT